MDYAAEAATVTEELPEGSIGALDDIYVDTSAHTSANVDTMDKDAEAAVVTDQHNEEAVEYEVHTEESSGTTEDMDVGASAHTSANSGNMGESIEAYAVPDQHN